MQTGQCHLDGTLDIKLQYHLDVTFNFEAKEPFGGYFSQCIALNCVLGYRDLDLKPMTLKLDPDLLQTKNEIAKSSHCKGIA